MTLLNSNYEQWRQANPAASYKDFPFKASAMGNSGAMFDLAKFNDVSKNVIAHMTADEVYAFVAEWAKENDPDFYALISADAEYLKKFLAIGRGGKSRARISPAGARSRISFPICMTRFSSKRTNIRLM